MSHVIGSRVRAPASRKAGSAATTTKTSEPRDVAVSICAIAYGGGKVDGSYSVTVASLPQDLKLPRNAIEEAVVAGENWGWLRRVGDRLDLTASGLYTAKLVLKLPT